MRRSDCCRGAALALLLIGALPSAGLAQEDSSPGQRSWVEEKCARYRDAWHEALARWGREGLGAEFVDRHEEFIAGGCTDQGKVCPRSPQELEMANILSIAAMNAGTASTFLPFGCRG